MARPSVLDVGLETVTGDPKQILAQQFGMDRFRDGQLAVIERLLGGKNVAAVFPTGGGKSLCYQLPALMLPGTTVVVSPLIALMKDQCDALAARGIGAARLDSSLTTEEFRDAMQGIRDGSIKMLYVAPERFFNERFLASVGTLDVSLFAIDEAHCISQWGHNFRPDYLKLAELAKQLSAKRVLALTATATPEVLADIRDAFAIEPEDAIRTKFFRPNLQLRSSVVDSETHYSVLLDRISTRPPGPTLVYVTLQRTAEEVAEQLVADGHPATAYHAGMKPEVRSQIQQDFIQSDSGIVVATIAFGMGIDKSNIRYVYHFNPPKSMESYAQEIGRAGRDGQDSVCELLLLPDDRVVLENFTYGDTPSRHNVGRLIDLIAGQADTFHVSHYKLSSETDIRILVVRTLLTYLELDGYIKATSPRYDTYKIKPRVTSQKILSHFKGEPREFAAGVLSSLTKGRTWFLLNTVLAARKLGAERQRVVKAIEHMAEQGWLEVQTSDLVHGYRWVNRLDDPKTLADDLHGRLARRESGEVGRLEGVFDLARSESCLADQLSQHFGESLDQPCGRCTACLGEGPQSIPQPPSRPLGSSIQRVIENLVREYPDRFVTARDRARFLCGLSSPGFIRSRLTRHDSYGVCDRIPFAQVLTQVGGTSD
ncbi:ATP-dependent DNA helicase RecQ [Rubripirellula lacrimiformis]|uniref:ATP-dependent DNA helicase RecQ n=1 Tax=Rubripirellula lacrimiformis TaxID=1930273 RepID=A0A517NIY8_9BACT|nr:RecQ family ATP-dependent DNA helicase [Rubripirellula lacrimiformis]QDT07013.1 ATP-dependent DNA helicase RecQ [Rubripirellula lacrimiformis]